MSRQCPSCRETFEDAVFFCGNDGAITIQVQDSKDVDPRLGKTIGDYVVVARVADGAMGRVYEGRHPESRARVAIKVLHSHVVRDDVAVERFKREFETAEEFVHAHIVSVLDFGRTPDHSYFMIMEFLQGEELGLVLQRRESIRPERVVRLVCQTALALQHAHSFGVIHRDLKPDNIFLCMSEDGDVVKLLDFGSVKLQMDVGAKLTAMGSTLGSPFYMSPEQAMGRQDVDQRSDVFALAAVAYEMVTGRVPFEGNSIAEILMRVVNEEPPPPSAINSKCSLEIDDVLLRALAKDKETRPAGAIEFAGELLAAYGLAGTVAEFASRPALAIGKLLEQGSREVHHRYGKSVPVTRSLVPSVPPPQVTPSGMELDDEVGLPTRSNRLLWAIGALATVGIAVAVLFFVLGD